MSRYCEIKTQFKNQNALVSALAETGNWTPEQIEVHSEPQNLFGYRGDMRHDTAHIIIRRKHIGTSSNDIGFRRTESGEYEAIISEYDRNSKKYNDEWLGKLKGNYAYHTVKQQQEMCGRTVIRERMKDGKQRVYVGGYR